MKKPVCIPSMHEAFRRVIGSDKPAIAILACKDPRIRRAVERMYEQIVRERESGRTDQVSPAASCPGAAS